MPDITPSQFRRQAKGLINLMGGIGGILAVCTRSVFVRFESRASVLRRGRGCIISSPRRRLRHRQDETTDVRREYSAKIQKRTRRDRHCRLSLYISSQEELLIL